MNSTTGFRFLIQVRSCNGIFKSTDHSHYQKAFICQGTMMQYREKREESCVIKEFYILRGGDTDLVKWICKCWRWIFQLPAKLCGDRREFLSNMMTHFKTAESTAKQYLGLVGTQELITDGSAYWWVCGTEFNFNRNSEKKVIMGGVISKKSSKGSSWQFLSMCHPSSAIRKEGIQSKSAIPSERRKAQGKTRW